MQVDTDATSAVNPELVREVDRLLEELSRPIRPCDTAGARRRAAAERELSALGIEGALAIQAIYRTSVASQQEALRSLLRFLPWFISIAILTFLTYFAFPRATPNTATLVMSIANIV